MTFLTVLIALFIERLSQQSPASRRYRWFDGYCRRLTGITAMQWLMSRRWGTAVVLLPPLLLIGGLQIWLAAISGLLALAFGVFVLLLSLGPRDLGRDTEAYIEARDQGHDEEANRLAQALCLTEIPEVEPRRSIAVARAVVVLAARRLVGPIFWFVAFGAVGAAAYRLIHLLAERLEGEACPQEMQRYSDEMRHVADWAPARISAAGYAVAGNFDAVAHAWRTFDYAPGEGPLTEAEHLLAQTGLAALDTFPDDVDELSGDAGIPASASLIPPVVEDALALVWRSLAMWVAVIGGGSLVAALA